MRSRAAGIGVIAMVLAGCAAVAQPSASPSASLAPTVGPLAVPSPTATPSTTPSPSPSLAAGPAWQVVGTATGGDVVGFANGYVALGGTADVEFSTDGRTWTPVRVPFHASKDPHGIALGAAAQALATDGHTVVVVGSYTHTPCKPANGAVGGGPECPSSPISWVTTDGATWNSSFPWHGPGAPKGYTQGTQFTNVWSVPTGGWDAAVMDVAGEAGAAGTIFHSADGLAWTPLPATPPTAFKGSPNPPELWHLGLADAGGLRLVGGYWYLSGGDSVARLFSSPNGLAWTALSGFPGNGVNADVALAPDPAHAPVWIVAGRDASAMPTVWTSSDLTTWAAQELPTTSPTVEGTVSSIAATHLGYIAVALLTDGPDGTPYHASWLSPDGVTWTELPAAGPSGNDGPDLIADGPAGIIGFDVYNGSEVPPGVWMLK